MIGRSGNAFVTVSHRETWQRFPKELEALPGELRLHIWPAHGRDHPEINPTDHAELYKLWFCHQDREMDLTYPWSYLLKIASLYDAPPTGSINPPSMAMLSVQTSGMGLAVTSDFLVGFATQPDEAQRLAEHHQQNIHALPDPAWTCASGAIGPAHPYNPQQFPVLEEIIEKANKARWATQDATDDYGMWNYRCWHDQGYKGDGVWNLHRAKTASHHYDSYIPWLLYARSADPDYFDQGCANIRFLADAQVIHYNDPAYPQQETTQNQRVVGAMRHATAQTPWSSDAHLTGHQICFNSLILAYYLTGDLRLREVVVDEWQSTLLADRANPNYAKAFFTTPAFRGRGRDFTNTLGELIDLYQLTYHPALVTMIDQMDALAMEATANWGIYKTNVFGFGRGGALKDYVLKLAAYQRTHSTDEIKKQFNDQLPPQWGYNHAGGDELAWSALLKPGNDDDLHAYLAYNAVDWLFRANDMANLVPGYGWVPVPDTTKILPRMMHALAQTNRSQHVPWLKEIAHLPTSFSHDWTRAIVREDRDHTFGVHIAGRIGVGGVKVKVISPSGRVVVDEHLPSAFRAVRRLEVPGDGETGQYVIFVGAKEGATEMQDHLIAPLTLNMPEVYVLDQYRQQRNSFFYVRATGEQPIHFTVSTPERRCIIYDADREHIIADWDAMDLVYAARAGQYRQAFEIPDDWKPPTKPVTVEVDRHGIYFTSTGRYITVSSPDQPLAYAVSPQRWFMPHPQKYRLQPPP